MDKHVRVRLVHQRRALRELSRLVESLRLRLEVAEARSSAGWRQLSDTQQAFARFRGNYFRRLFGWRIHVSRNNWVIWPPISRERERLREQAALLSALRRYGYHEGGCTKFNGDKLDERRPCSCGLTAAFASRYGRCQCSSCRQDRLKRHQRWQKPIAVAE